MSHTSTTDVAMPDKQTNHVQHLPNSRFNLFVLIRRKIVAAFQGTHVWPAKHSFAWLPRKCDYQIDRPTDRCQTKSSLCAAMLHRQHKIAFEWPWPLTLNTSLYCVHGWFVHVKCTPNGLEFSFIQISSKGLCFEQHFSTQSEYLCNNEGHT